jgi:hypothetical protein
MHAESITALTRSVFDCFDFWAVFQKVCQSPPLRWFYCISANV